MDPDWISTKRIQFGACISKCCSDRVFYDILFTFPGLGGTPGDRSMLLRPCILQYIINFPGFGRDSRRELDAAQTVYFTIYY